MMRSSWITLLLWMTVTSVAWGQTAKPAETLPPADAVFARYIDVVGGAAALQAKESMVSKGTFELVGMGVQGVLETYRAVPNLQYDRIEIEGLGLQEQGFDGNVAWERSTMLGPNILEGERHDLAELDAEFFPELHHERLYESVKTVGEVEFAGTPCYEVLALSKGGHERHLFFAVESGLLSGLRESRATEMGAIDMEVHLGDYQTFDDVLVPTTMETSVLGQTQRFTIESTSFDTIDPFRFQLPDDVKVLLDEDS